MRYRYSALAENHTVFEKRHISIELAQIAINVLPFRQRW